MTFDTPTILALLSLLVTLALGVLVFVNNRRANRTAEKKLTVEEQQAEYDREDVISKRRREELDRAYVRLDELEADVAVLKRSLKAHQRTIDTLEGQAAIAERREVLVYRHTKALREHIVNQLPPPPPTMPVDLVAWFEQFEMTDPPVGS